MRDLKYILIGLPMTEPKAIVFNGMFIHADIYIGAMKSMPNAVIYSAGFCSIDNGEIKVWGDSESLSELLNEKVKSDIMDSYFIGLTLNRMHNL